MKFNAFRGLNNVKIIVYNDSSFGYSDNAGSQAGFILFLDNFVGDMSPIMWQSKRLCWTVKSTLASGTLTKVGFCMMQDTSW